MKKLITTIALALGIATCTLAQSIDPQYFDTTLFKSIDSGYVAITPPVSTIPGLSPAGYALPCAVIGHAVSDTLHFKTFVPFVPDSIISFTFDSMYLPAGLVWRTSSATNTFAEGEDGLILIQGTPTAPMGIYRLRIIVDIYKLDGSHQYVEAGTTAHDPYRLRLIADQVCSCPSLGRADSASAYTAISCAITPENAISEVAASIDHISIQPNPFSGAAKVNFTSAISGTFSMKLTNLLGAVVSSKEVEIYAGQNELMMDRNGLASGVYLMSISNEKGAVTRKVTID